MKKIFTLFSALTMCAAANAVEYVTYPAGPASIDEFNNEFVVEFTGATTVELDEWAWIELKNETQYNASEEDDAYWEFVTAFMTGDNLTAEGNKVHFSLADCIDTLVPGSYYLPVYGGCIYVDGQDVNYMVLSFTVSEPASGFNFQVYPSTTTTVTPADFAGNEVVLEFAEGTVVTYDDYAWLEMKNSAQYNADPEDEAYVEYVGASDAFDWVVEGNKLHINFFYLLIDATDTYYLHIPAGTIFANGEDQGDILLTFNVSAEGQSQVEAVELAVEPEIYHDFTITAPEGWTATGLGNNAAAYLLDVYYDYVCGVNLEVADGKVVGHIPADIEAGAYVLVVDAGAVVLNDGEGQNVYLMQEVTLVDGNPVGIYSLNAEGQQTIYNLNGQRQSHITKGVNIINGKTVVVNK